MELGLLSVLLIGFGLGIKHAVEPDHIIAVTTIASKSKNLWQSSLTGLFWGIGHTMTILAVGLVLIIFKNQIPPIWAMSLEFCVGIMLVYLGIATLLAYKHKKVHFHGHEHESKQHKHFHSHKEDRGYSHNHAHHNSHSASFVKSFIIGSIHGLAGSAAVVVLTMSTVKSVYEGTIYIIVFGLGTVFGMLFFTTIVGIPFVFSSGRPSSNFLAPLAGTISTIYGFYFMYNLGVTERLFKLWWQ